MVRYISNFIKVILATSITLTAHAWEPTKPVTAVIGFAPGSGNELSFRGFSSLIEKANPKINFIVENRPGGDGTIGMNHFIKQPNDGYHIYVASHQGIWVTAEFANPENKKYALDDFEYGLTLAKSPLAIIAHHESPTNTPREFMDRMKNPQKPISIAAGSGAHKLAYEYMMYNIKGNRELIKTVPYKGPAQAGQDVAGGHLAGMNVYAAWGIIFPKGTNKDIINWYVTNFRTAINSPEGKQFIKDNLMFAEPREQNPKGFEASMMDLRKQWIPIIKEVGWNN